MRENGRNRMNSAPEHRGEYIEKCTRERADRHREYTGPMYGNAGEGRAALPCGNGQRMADGRVFDDAGFDAAPKKARRRKTGWTGRRNTAADRPFAAQHMQLRRNGRVHGILTVTY